MQKLLVTLSGATFLGALAAAIAFFLGADHAAGISLGLVTIAVAVGMPALMVPLGTWGVPGDRL
jgi:hypothetical protein